MRGEVFAEKKGRKCEQAAGVIKRKPLSTARGTSLRDTFLSPPEADSSSHGEELGGLGGTRHRFYKIMLAELAFG